MSSAIDYAQKKFAAEVAGNAAFKVGRTRVPCLDKNCMDLLEGCAVGEGVPIMIAWSKGWDSASLSDAT